MQKLKGEIALKNIKWKAILALSLAAAVFIGAPRADAEIRITIKNNRSHNISFAFCWNGFDSPDDRRSGWYNVKAGETRTITFKDAIAPLTMDGFGYYAEGGGSVWRGDMRQVIIHPKKSFGGHPNGSVQGGKKVGFRKISLKKVGDANTDAVATLTFNP